MPAPRIPGTPRIEPYLSVAELADRLDVRQNTVREGALRGTIPSHRVPMLTSDGTRLGFLWSECVRFVGKPVSDSAPQLDTWYGEMTGDTRALSPDEWRELVGRLIEASDALHTVMSEVACAGDAATANAAAVGGWPRTFADFWEDEAPRTILERLAPRFDALDAFIDAITTAVSDWEHADEHDGDDA